MILFVLAVYRRGKYDSSSKSTVALPDELQSRLDQLDDDDLEIPDPVLETEDDDVELLDALDEI